MVGARYDAIADFYEAGWSDSVDDPGSVALLDLLGAVAGLRVLEVACGHGRITRELARRGADVVGVDISAALIRKAELAEDEQPRGIRYIHADAASQEWWDGAQFDRVVCNFGLSDIDELDRTIAGIGRALLPTGCFVFSILHPCFAGGQNVSGAWPTTGSYYDEGWWSADGVLSTLRRQVGANHRTLSTYVNTLRRNDLWLDEVVEPMPPLEWTALRADAARFPVFLAARCVRGPMR
jgi:ubiquinone/menaquinone biosynthesis C-methylase UbiE